MAELQEMVCKGCEEVKTKDELTSNNGYCDECAVGRCIVCSTKMSDAEIEQEKMLCDECEKAGLGDSGVAPIADEDELTPEQAKALKAYVKHQAFMREYNQRPDVKAKRKQYQKDRNKRNAQVIKRLREMGVIESKRSNGGAQ